MRSFILGILLGVCFEGAVTAVAKDYLGRSPQQQQYHYFRERQQQLDVEHLRKQLDEEKFEGHSRRLPC